LNKQITLDQLVELAKVADGDEYFDFGMLEIDEEHLYKVVAGAVCKNYMNTPADSRDIIYLSSIINLQVKNFALACNNTRLLNTISSLTNKLNSK
jgi:hypothetical protein